MATYPKDFPDVLAGVWDDIKSGHFKGDSKDALGEAWHRWRKKHHKPELSTQQRRYAYRKSFENPSGVRVVYNKLLGGWYVVRGPHQTPLNGRFETKADALAWLSRKNPGEKWHLEQATKAHLKAKRAPDKEERDHDIGQFEAHLESARASRRGVNPRKRKVKHDYKHTGSGKCWLCGRPASEHQNPAPTERARRFFGAELRRRRTGKRTVTGLPTKELREMASKNPRQTYQLRTIFVDKGTVLASPHWTTISADTELAAVKKFIKQKQLRSKGLMKVGDTYQLGIGGAAIEFKIVPRNPIAVYNPPSSSMRLLYARAFIPKVYGTKTTGEHKGEKFVHDFKTEVKIYGLPKGGLLIQSLDGSRLWADERDLDKFERR